MDNTLGGYLGTYVETRNPTNRPAVPRREDGLSFVPHRSVALVPRVVGADDASLIACDLVRSWRREWSFFFCFFIKACDLYRSWLRRYMLPPLSRTGGRTPSGQLRICTLITPGKDREQERREEARPSTTPPTAPSHPRPHCPRPSLSPLAAPAFQHLCFSGKPGSPQSTARPRTTDEYPWAVSFALSAPALHPREPAGQSTGCSS
jgi:hypothetical protein